MKFASGEQLAQSRPSGTTAASVYTASLHTEITSIVVCNTSSAAASMSVYHDDDGSTFDETTALHFAQPVPAKTTVYLTSDAVGSGILIAASGQLGVQTSVANALTFTVYGITEELS